MISQVLGGIGLFLVGMVSVTDGLRAAAGDTMRVFLLRFTGGPMKALLSGATVTALIQSSSATTVATIGFVGAGLLTFEQALNVIFGANLGTTATGWIVALLGLKFSVSAVALPVIGVGALIKLFAPGRAGHLGVALSGFGIIFLGLDVLQAGMEGVSGYFTPQTLPSDTLVGRLLLVGIGVVLTTVMQSSSAAVATALAALHGGSISLQQAAAMVIGINIGTTVTAGVAAIGGSTAAKRTAFAHLLFNALTGLVAFASLPVFVALVASLGRRVAPSDEATLLAAFHTAFNLLGVLLVLPFSARFAALVVRVVRERGPRLTRLLDSNAATQGVVAVEAVRQTTIEIARAMLEAVHEQLVSGRASRDTTERLESACAALHQTEEYLAALSFGAPLSPEGHRRHLSTVHALDRLGRLADLSMDKAAVHPTSAALAPAHTLVGQLLSSVAAWSDDPDAPAPVEGARHAHEAVRDLRHQRRPELLEETARGEVNPTVAARELDHLRWLEEFSFHSWRLLDRLQGERMTEQPAAET